MGRPKGSKNGQHAGQYTCLRCGKVVHTKPSEAAHRLYCSEACFRTPRPTVICQRCGEPFVQDFGSHGVYCSLVCARAQTSNRVEKTCPQCGKSFGVKASRAAKFTYCSLACRRTANHVEAICQHCGKVFKTQRARQSTTRFCSRACADASHRSTLVCANCGQPFSTKRYRAVEGQRCCSNRCATLLRMSEGWQPGYIGRKVATGYRTDIETIAENVLRRLGVPYLFEHKVGRYSVDFALPTLGVALECDGWQHLTTKGRERDTRRDAFLVSEGWRAVHVLDRALRDDALSAIGEALHLSPVQST